MVLLVLCLCPVLGWTVLVCCASSSTHRALAVSSLSDPAVWCLGVQHTLLRSLVQACQIGSQFLPLGFVSVWVDFLGCGVSLCRAVPCNSTTCAQQGAPASPRLVQRYLSRRCYFITLASLGSSKSHVEWHAAYHG
jgi:hypothetical protein